MKNIFLGLIAVSLIFVLGGCDDKNGKPSAQKITTLNNIKDRGVLRVGVKGDTYKFGYKDPYTGIIDGFDVDIAKTLAKQILGSEKKLKTVAVTTANRGELLDSGELDYVIATFTITEERKKIYNFSSQYFIDSGIGMMVKKESNIRSFKDLNHKKVGVAKATTAVKAMQDAADKAGIRIELVEFDIYPSVKAALATNDIDAFATNAIILLSYMDDSVMLLDEKLSPQAYGIASKKGNDELTFIADKTISALKSSGDMKNIIAKWGLQ